MNHPKVNGKQVNFVRNEFWERIKMNSKISIISIRWRYKPKEPVFGIFSEEDHSQCSANQMLATKQAVFAVLREQNISCRLSHKAFTERLGILLS